MPHVYHNKVDTSLNTSDRGKIETEYLRERPTNLPIVCKISSGISFPTKCNSFNVEFDWQEASKARPPIGPILFQRKSKRTKFSFLSVNQVKNSPRTRNVTFFFNATANSVAPTWLMSLLRRSNSIRPLFTDKASQKLVNGIESIAPNWFHSNLNLNRTIIEKMFSFSFRVFTFSTFDFFWEFSRSRRFRYHEFDFPFQREKKQNVVSNWTRTKFYFQF